MDAESYHGTSGSLHKKLVSRFFHNGSIYKYDNTSVYMNIENSARVTLVESTFKEFPHHTDGKIQEEMKKIREVFELYDGDPNNITGYQEITTNLMFDIKLGEKCWR